VGQQPLEVITQAGVNPRRCLVGIPGTLLSLHDALGFRIRAVGLVIIPAGTDEVDAGVRAYSCESDHEIYDRGWYVRR